MIHHQGIWLPDGETHLTQWMTTSGEIVDGKGTYQIKKLRKAVSFCNRFRAAVDVGAHCGMWSMQLVKQFEFVHAFEPVAAHRECFQKNIRTDKVDLHAVALGDRAGSVSIKTAPTSSGDSWVAGPGDIPLCRLDDFGLVDIDFLKVDVEGSELAVLRGAEQMLRTYRPVCIIEQKPGHAQRFGFGERDAIPYLESLGAKLRAEMSGDFVMSWDD